MGRQKKEKMTHFRIISDIHGRKSLYLKMILPATYSLQLGDLDFNYDWMKGDVDHKNHWFFGGNHDNYDVIKNSPHNLGDFGVKEVPELGNFFFIRGAWSIDQKIRKKHISWWPQEELSYAESLKAIELYEATKPEILITHQTSQKIAKTMGLDPDFAIDCGWNESFPNHFMGTFFDQIFEIHQPKFWFFGHYHLNWIKKVDKTTFVCINQYEYVDFAKGEWKL